MFKFTLLRFSGFNDEWETKMLKDVSTINPKTKDLPNEFVYIDLDSVENGILTKKNKICIEDAPSRAQRLLDVNDILFQTVRPYQMNNLYFDYDDDNYVASTGYAQIKSKINSRYLYHYLHYSKFVNEVLKRCTGTSYPAINANDLKKIKIKIPSDLDEQMFIGSIFDRIDEKIELLEKKHQYYQYFKKFLMQQIFAQKLRFNFIDDWDVVKLETLIEKGKAGGTPPSTNPDYYNGEIPFLSIKDMTEQGKYIVKTEKSITEEGLNNSSAWIIPKYSLLYSIYASIGLVSINLTEVSTSQAIYGIILKEGVSLEYMYYYLTYFKKNIHRYVETGTQGNLNAKLLKSFEIALPSVDEQEMIVNILSLVDKKIENMEKEVGKMNEFKKGLIQQMFI